MRLARLPVRQKRKFKVATTDSARNYAIAPNLLGQNFTASRPNEKWVADIIYIATDAPWFVTPL